MMKKSLAPMIWMLLVIVLGVAFITANANTVEEVTSSLPVSGESHSIATTRLASNNINESVQLTLTHVPISPNYLAITGFVLKNATGSAATITTDYLVNLSNGKYTLKNSTFWTSQVSNSSTTDYNYYTANYDTNPGSRSIWGLIDFITALGVLMAVVSYLNWDEIKRIFGK